MLSIIAIAKVEKLKVEGLGFVEQTFKAPSVEDARQQMEEMGYYDPADFEFTILGEYVPSPTTWRDYHNKTVYAR